MKRIKRILAVVLCVLLLVLPVLSHCFIATHKTHNCTGKNCAVCLELTMAEHIIMTCKTILLCAAGILITIRTFFLSQLYEKQIHRIGDTLITLKVELLN